MRRQTSSRIAVVGGAHVEELAVLLPVVSKLEPRVSCSALLGGVGPSLTCSKPRGECSRSGRGPRSEL